MTDFLLELLSEEIPARMQAKARDDLARLFEAELAKSGLKAESLETYATPRRLALIARGLPTETAATAEELKGPRASAPPQALEGFLRKTGLVREQLVERDGILFAVIDRPGRATAAVLAEAIPAIVRAFPWPKSMRWGDASASTESLRWVRPLQGIVALLGDDVVDCEIAGIRSGAATWGHRFHHPGIITIGNADDYAAKLRACHVIVDQDERARLIREGAAAAAAAAGLTLVEDEGLVQENAGLTEWPVPLLGGFDAAFLEVPREVIQLTMRTNQKYFALVRSSPERGGGPAKAVEGAPSVSAGALPPPRSGEDLSSLAPNFICTANIDASDGGAAIVAGNERVLSARLADAKFFWEQDRKVPLEDQAKKLGQIVFHEKLGTLADKVDRVAKLARWLVEEGIVGGPTLSSATNIRHSREGGNPDESSARETFDANELDFEAVEREAEDDGDLGSRFRGNDKEREDLAQQAETAARLCKADLVTQMVGEFPELQGIIGGHLARAQGHDPAVADAIRDHYKPVGQGDEAPTAPVTVAVSVADKLDTLICFFAVDEKPTGSKDPFALRRAALGVIQLVLANGLRFSVDDTLERIAGDVTGAVAAADLASAMLGNICTGEAGLHWFFAERLKVQQREAGARHDLIDAVFKQDDDLVRLLARVKALQAFVETAEGADLLAGYKRAANILKKEGYTPLPQGEGGAQPEAGRVRVTEASPSASGADAPPPSPAGRGKSLSYTPEKEETALIAALDEAEPLAREAVAREDFEAAMAALASLRAPVDAFFDKVTVNDPDPARRAARLDLLARMRDAVHQVADFSRIEG